MSDKSKPPLGVSVQQSGSHESTNTQGIKSSGSNLLPPSSSSHKKAHKDNETGSHQHHTSQSSSSQSHPKKKGGFVITSVKDNVDGDESADDLDESHASYSDISYSKATDVDHDEESSTSDEVLNTTVQDGTVATPTSTNHLPHQVQNTNSILAGSNQIKQVSETSTQVSLASSTSDIKNPADVLSNTKADVRQEVPLDSKSPPESSSGIQIAKPNTKSNANGQQSANNPLQNSQSQQSSQFKVPITHKTGNFNASGAPANTTTTVTKSSSTSSTTAKSASRVYKVVKRETQQPIRRESSRWVCYDFGDAQSPNFGFVPSSSSDSRINAYDHVQLFSPAIPPSMSTTSVPSSVSAYSLQHSDSASSIHRDSHYGLSTASNVTVQHSASTSSVLYDPDGNKLPRSAKLTNDPAEISSKASASNTDDRPGKSTSDQELTPNVMHSSGELSTTVETEDESSTSTNVRIDNKIEAAMDLVKKHLMLAVRDEVDELKEKIVELQQEIDVMKGILTPEQFAKIQSILSKPSKLLQMPLVQSQQLVHAQGVPHSSSAAHAPDVTVTSQPQPHANQGQGQPPPHSISSAGRANPPVSMQGQAKPLPTNIPGAVTNPSQLNQQQQQISSQPQQSTRPVAYQQASSNFPPNPQTVSTATSQLTPQQVQALRQQSYSSAPSSGTQAVYQTPPVVMQQPNLTSQPNPAAPTQSNHALQQPPSQKPSNVVPGTAPVVSLGLNQFPQTAQQVPRLPTQNVQVPIPAASRPQQPNPLASSNVANLPSMQTQAVAPGSPPPVYSNPQSAGSQPGEVRVPKT